MHKKLLLSSLLISSIFADSYLGKPIHASTATPKPEILQKPIQTKNYSKTIRNDSPIVENKNIVVNKHFREDHHRYDKRFNDFNYDDNAYYNDDGYYYGYYNRDGYFYDNIFFTYNSRYSYYDRHHHRGYFQNRYHHERTYVYHYVNDWNQVHCYREPNERIYGHYYDRPSYVNHSYYQRSRPEYRDTARMSTRRMQMPRTSNHQNNNQRSYNNHNTHRNTARMSTRNSRPNNHHKKSTTHMQLAK